MLFFQVLGPDEALINHSIDHTTSCDVDISNCRPQAWKDRGLLCTDRVSRWMFCSVGPSNELCYPPSLTYVAVCNPSPAAIFCLREYNFLPSLQDRPLSGRENAKHLDPFVVEVITVKRCRRADESHVTHSLLVYSKLFRPKYYAYFRDLTFEFVFLMKHWLW